MLAESTASLAFNHATKSFVNECILRPYSFEILQARLINLILCFRRFGSCCMRMAVDVAQPYNPLALTSKTQEV
jgi:hypothetical protein